MLSSSTKLLFDAFTVALLLAVFSIPFGTAASTTEHHHGMMPARSPRLTRSLVAFAAVGLYVE